MTDVTSEDVARRLADTELAGAPLTEVPLPNSGSTWVVDLGERELWQVWSQTRAAFAEVNLHPVAVTRLGETNWLRADLFGRAIYGRSDDPGPEAVIARSHELSVDDALRHFASLNAWAVENRDDVPVGDVIGLERRLLEWEESLSPTDPPKVSEAFGWHDPRPHGPVGLVLLPVREPCNAAAYLSFYGARGDGGHEALIRLMRDWQAHFGAELIASWGTMLQFVVTSPPATLDEAFDLAAQHVQVAPCTTALPGEGVRQLARHLWRGPRWFLHERP